MADAYQDLLEYIVKGIVDHPDDVKLDRKVDEMGVLLTLKVNPEDMGLLIGREGSTARSIRTLIRIAGLKAHARVNLKIEEPEGGRVPRKESTDEKKESIDDLKI
ncbi:MAG: KH domain-containing protein [bacterium]|nr:KH domain-containing protein [bacterium]